MTKKQRWGVRAMVSVTFEVLVLYSSLDSNLLQLVGTWDQAWVKKENSNQQTAVQCLFWEQNKHASIDFPKWYKTKRSYFHSWKPHGLTKALWSYVTQGICVLLAERHCFIPQRGRAANGMWKLIAEFLPGSPGSAGSAVLCRQLLCCGAPEEVW